MLGLQIPAFNGLRLRRFQRFAFQVIVNVIVGHAQRDFIWQRRAVIFEIGGRCFLIEMLRAAKLGQQLFTLTLVEAEDWVDVGTALSIKKKETGDGFCCMIGPDDDAVGHTGNAVLCFHAFAGFFIAANKVAQFNTGFT
mgnify:CR=1 FL=1